MEILHVDDCIKSIKLEDNTFLYYRTRTDCEYDENNDNINEYHFDRIPYEIGQKLNIEVLDVGGSCFLDASVKINIILYIPIIKIFGNVLSVKLILYIRILV